MAEVNLHGELTLHVLTNIGNAEHQKPTSRDYRTGQERGRGVCNGKCEGGLVSAAPSSKSYRVEDAEIDRSALLSARMSELNTQPFHTLGDREGNLFVCLVVCVSNDTTEEYIGTLLCRRMPGAEEQTHEKSGAGELERPLCTNPVQG